MVRSIDGHASAVLTVEAVVVEVEVLVKKPVVELAVEMKLDVSDDCGTPHVRFIAR